MIQGAKATSTKEIKGPRKKGPVAWEALTRAVIAVCRVSVSVEWSAEGEVGRGWALGSWSGWEIGSFGGVSRRA